ncbi:InlB B-repeat-containing protein [Paenibacillus wenxiniae]|uniref:InlB B-repeat-containing protein n=1 Tax=Paenibacillus wenxiniae TaxID=1636843 RepID=A0ABW4RN25_9BACL
MLHYACRASWKIALAFVLVFATLSTGSNTMRSAHAAAAEPYIGEIQLFPYGFAPDGWMFAAGQILTIQSNTALYSTMGTSYGGDGRTNFAIPNLTGLPVPDGMAYYIATTGIFPPRDGAGSGTNSALLGEVHLFPYFYVPGDWLKLDGSVKNKADYPELSTLLNPSGNSTFTLPNISSPLPGQSLFYAIAAKTGANQVGKDLTQLTANDQSYLLTGEVLSFLTPMQTSFFPANGSQLNVMDQQALFSLLGTRFGGNGYSNFGLPNMSTNPYSFSMYIVPGDSSHSTIYPSRDSNAGPGPSDLAVTSTPYTVGSGTDALFNKTPMLSGGTGTGVSLRTLPQHGTVVDLGSSFNYKSDTNYTGSDSFTVRTYNTNGFANGYSTVNINVVSTSPPTIMGVSNNGMYNHAVTPIITNNGASVLNNQPYGSGTPVTGEGNYTLVATNSYGTTQIKFTIDLTPPTVSGVSNGGRYTVPPTTITLSDGTATLNGVAFASGTSITGEGNYTLVATDAANNSNTIAFSYYAPRQLTFDSAGGTSIATQNVYYGDHGVQPTAPTRTGYTFTGWYSDAARTQLFDFTNTAVVTSMQLYAGWSINQYTVSFNSSGGTAIADVPVNFGATVSKPTMPTRTGYTFTGWYTDAAHTRLFDFANTTVTANIPLYAGWSLNQYTVGFNSNGGTAVAAVPVNYGLTISAPAAPTRTGYTFTGWYTDAAHKQLFDFAHTVVTANTQLYAGWSINPYTISFDSSGGTPVADRQLNYGSLVSEPTAPIRTGYTFAGWYTDAVHTQRFDFSATTVAANLQLYAGWTLQSYAVTFDAYQGANVPTQTIPYGTLISRPIDPVQFGYTFTGWYADAAHTQPFDFQAIITTPVTVYAGWSVNQYTASFNSKGGTAVISQTLDYGSPLTEPQQPDRIGYTFKGWYSDAATGQRFDFTTATIRGDIQLYAGWERNQYTVGFDTYGGSVIRDVYIGYGDRLILPNAPTADDAGSVFAGWFADPQHNLPFDFSQPIISNVILYAKWAVRVQQITFDTDGGTAISAQTAAYGDRLSRPADPERPGYTFAGWYSDAAHSQSFDFAATTVTADMTLYAKWSIAMRTVKFNVNGGTVVVTQTVNHGDRLSRPNDPTREGFTFNGWYTDTARSQPVDFTAAVTADMTLYAGWTVVTPSDGRNKGGSAGNRRSDANTNLLNHTSNAESSVLIPAGQAGELRIGSGVSLQVPAGAADQPLEIQANLMTTPPTGLANNQRVVSPVYEFLKNMQGNFKIPVKLTLSFDPATLRSGEKLAVFYQTGANTPWTIVDNGSIDGNSISVNVNHFTRFTVMAVPQTTTPIPSPADGNTVPVVTTFSDTDSHWAAASIREAAALGIVKGYADGTFHPGASVTRAEFAAMLVRMLKPVEQTDTSSALPAFTDAAKIGAWAQSDIAQASALGWIKGNADGSFRPNVPITRAEMAVMVSRAMALTGATSVSFGDAATIPVWAKAAASQMQQSAWMNGRVNGHFDPSAVTTRAEAAQVLMRAHQQ